jgi:hypothetical protein
VTVGVAAGGASGVGVASGVCEGVEAGCGLGSAGATASTGPVDGAGVAAGRV